MPERCLRTSASHARAGVAGTAERRHSCAAAGAATTLCGHAERMAQVAQGPRALRRGVVDLAFGDRVAYAHVHSLAS